MISSAGFEGILSGTSAGNSKRASTNWHTEQVSLSLTTITLFLKTIFKSVQEYLWQVKKKYKYAYKTYTTSFMFISGLRSFVEFERILLETSAGNFKNTSTNWHTEQVSLSLTTITLYFMLWTWRLNHFNFPWKFGAPVGSSSPVHTPNQILRNKQALPLLGVGN